MNDKQLQALVRKNALKAARATGKPRTFSDPTLEATRSPERDDADAQRIFKEMKKREF